MRKSWATCLVSGALLFGHAAWAATSTQTQVIFEIHCPGRNVMTVAQSRGGLSTLKWDANQFQVAAGHHRGTLSNGQPVSFTRFRNGDRLIINTTEGSVWFVYSGEHRPVSCQRSQPRESQVLTLQTYYPGSDPTA